MAARPAAAPAAVNTLLPTWLAVRDDFQRHIEVSTPEHLCSKPPAARTRTDLRAVEAWLRRSRQLRILPGGYMRALARFARLQRARRHDVLQFSPAIKPKLWIVYSGAVAICTDEHVTRMLGPLSCFGCIEGMRGAAATQHVIAVEPTVLLWVSQRDFDAGFASQRATEARLNIDFLSSLSLFRGWSTPDVVTLASRMQRTLINPGDVIVDQDAKVDELIIVKQGRCDIVYHHTREVLLGPSRRSSCSRRTEAASTALGYLGPGDIVSVRAFIKGTPAFATTRATTVVEALVLPMSMALHLLRGEALARLQTHVESLPSPAEVDRRCRLLSQAEAAVAQHKHDRTRDRIRESARKYHGLAFGGAADFADISAFEIMHGYSPHTHPPHIRRALARHAVGVQPDIASRGTALQSRRTSIVARTHGPLPGVQSSRRASIVARARGSTLTAGGGDDGDRSHLQKVSSVLALASPDLCIEHDDGSSLESSARGSSSHAGARADPGEARPATATLPSPQDATDPGKLSGSMNVLRRTLGLHDILERAEQRRAERETAEQRSACATWAARNFGSAALRDSEQRAISAWRGPLGLRM